MPLNHQNRDQSYTFDSPSLSGHSPMINYRKDAKKGVRFTFMVVGESGTGKTTFINSLLSQKVLNHRYEPQTTRYVAASETKTLTFTSAKSVALPNTSILTRDEFNPETIHEEPGIALTETNVEIIDDEGLKLLLSIIDAPGFGENLNNELCFVEIESYLKQQFDLVLAEETRIKRNPRFSDTRVHVLLYFITPTGHGLREIDIQCMKRLSKYVNIIPIIGRADSFTPKELEYFKTQIRTDIENFNVPVFSFDNYLSEYDEEEDYDIIRECKYLANLQPFAIISSEDEYEIRDPKTGQTSIVRARKYPWGIVDINDPKISDFSVLKSVLLGSHLQDLKDLTHDFLYETYRTERLTKVTGARDLGSTDELNDDIEFHDTVEHHPDLLHQESSQFSVNSATVPSLSNLAQLTNTLQGSSTNGDLSSLTSDHSLKKSKSMLLEEEEEGIQSSHLKDIASFTSSTSTISLENSHKHHPHEATNPQPRASQNAAFKRLSIGPQRSQLRQISETVPYVIRHERILERQQKLEEMEMASAKELAHRASLLEQKAAELKAKERALKKRLDLERQRKQSLTSQREVDEFDEEEGVSKDNGYGGNHHQLPKDATLTDLHSIVSSH
ncbi:Septin-domain-containing protein [Scheffersomyces xylosifermentans]|uniref:Septin-domain-containing protein n=1 Tax=Scheffersomyces xylosifermentans TaxID=1304137 RepID=UPI00315D979E